MILKKQSLGDRVIMKWKAEYLYEESQLILLSYTMVCGFSLFAFIFPHIVFVV